ncbi:MAG: type I methionyl aminopeptidase [Actinomyces sp.]|nr:MAG: type I methionyl aminopeptidase [Actinomyces sp.]
MAKRKRQGSPRAVIDVPPSDPPVRPGLLSPPRPVPRHIERPPYARTGDPGPSVSSLVRTPEELAAMRRAGRLAAEVLIVAGENLRVGMTTDEIDRIVHEATIERGGYPSPLGYRGYPKSVCTSVNEVICHGIPDSRPLADGDIVNIDVTLYIDGVHGDTSATFMLGDVDEHSQRLVAETRNALELGIAAVRPGAPVNVIGRAIESHARRHGLGVVREFIGHGIGTEFHSRLQIPHYHDRRATTRLEEGMTFTIEPMLTLGRPDVAMWDDEWTAVTLDGRRTAQFEHTLVVTPEGAEKLTVTADGTCAHELFTEPVRR